MAKDELPLKRREILVGGVGALITGGAIAGCPTPSTTDDASMGADAPGTDGGGTDGGGTDVPGIDGGTDAPADVPPDAPTAVEPPEEITESAEFDLGVAAGDVTTDAAILWTYREVTAPLRVVVWQMDGETYVRQAFSAEAAPVEGFLHVEATGLTSSTSYRYAFFELSGSTRTARSTIGRFVTPPADDVVEPITLGAVSCISNMRPIDTLADAARQTNLSFFAFLGDNSYNDGARTLTEYRDVWRTNMARPEFRALRASTSIMATWDDHEFDNDYNPERLDAAQRSAAIRAFFEHHPLRRDGASADQVYKSLRWGGTLEVFVLDCRNERRPSTRGTPSAEYISTAQMDWLKTGLRDSAAVFKLILNSVPITDFPLAFDIAAADRWEGYPAQREEILRFIDETPIEGVLWVAGDFHLASSQRVARSGVGARQLEILVGPAAQTGNALAFTLTGPQFDFATGTNNYAVLELDPALRSIAAVWRDRAGSVIERVELLVP